MKIHRLSIPALLCAAMLTSPGLAVVDPDALDGVTHTPLVGGLHELHFHFGDGANAVASIGADGVLLVDAGFAETAEATRKTLDDLGGGPVRYLVNTHLHGDHTGGNAVLGEGATIIAHPRTREYIGGAYFALPSLARAGMPAMTVADEMTLHFNGEAVRIFHTGVGHTDGDLVVHFTESNVACLGDLLFSNTFPFIHVARGGDAERCAEVLGRLIDEMPAETIFVGGHGGPLDMDGLRAYHEVLARSISAVRGELAVGRSIDEIHDSGLLDEWKDYDGDTLCSARSWIRWISDSLAARADGPRPSICEMMTDVIMRDGVAAAFERYHDCAQNEPGAWEFGENELNMLGYQLMWREMVDEAIAVFELNTEVWPESGNVFDSLGEAYMGVGRTDEAIGSYERALELAPDNENAVEQLKTLRGGGE